MTTVIHAGLYGRFIEIQSNLWRKKLYTTNQGPNLLGGSFSNIDHVRAPIQFRREIQSQHLNDTHMEELMCFTEFSTKIH